MRTHTTVTSAYFKRLEHAARMRWETAPWWKRAWWTFVRVTAGWAGRRL